MPASPFINLIEAAFSLERAFFRSQTGRLRKGEPGTSQV